MKFDIYTLTKTLLLYGGKIDREVSFLSIFAKQNELVDALLALLLSFQVRFFYSKMMFRLH